MKPAQISTDWIAPDWIAIDWGSSHLRIWAMGMDGRVLAKKTSVEGAGGLQSHQFEAVLHAHIDEWLSKDSMPILACGMVGSRQGWVEAPYDKTPTKPAQKMIRFKGEDSRLDMAIIAGICQSQPADIMRGEETQIAGFLAMHPDYKGVLCLPGTHSKWVKIEDGQIIHFKTMLTGELFALLSKQSVLRHSLGVWDDDYFIKAVEKQCKQTLVVC